MLHEYKWEADTECLQQCAFLLCFLSSEEDTTEQTLV